MLDRAFRISHPSDVNDEIRGLSLKMFFLMIDSDSGTVSIHSLLSLSPNHTWASEHPFRMTAVVVHMFTAPG
jgi:hypothetical protein